MAVRPGQLARERDEEVVEDVGDDDGVVDIH